MTQEQNDRIVRATRELENALTEAGGMFHIDTHAIEARMIDSCEVRYVYQLTITQKFEEVIA